MQLDESKCTWLMQQCKNAAFVVRSRCRRPDCPNVRDSFRYEALLCPLFADVVMPDCKSIA